MSNDLLTMNISAVTTISNSYCNQTLMDFYLIYLAVYSRKSWNGWYVNDLE